MLGSSHTRAESDFAAADRLHDKFSDDLELLASPIIVQVLGCV